METMNNIGKIYDWPETCSLSKVPRVNKEMWEVLGKQALVSSWNSKISENLFEDSCMSKLKDLSDINKYPLRSHRGKVEPILYTGKAPLKLQSCCGEFPAHNQTYQYNPGYICSNMYQYRPRGGQNYRRGGKSYY